MEKSPANAGSTGTSGSVMYDTIVDIPVPPPEVEAEPPVLPVVVTNEHEATNEVTVGAGTSPPSESESAITGSTGADTTKAAAAAEAEVQPPDQTVEDIEANENEVVGGKTIHNMYILPPRQKNDQPPMTTAAPQQLVSPPSSTTMTMPSMTMTGVVALPPLQCDEQVQSIRVALMDIIPYSHYTNYRLELEIGSPSTERIQETTTTTGVTANSTDTATNTATAKSGVVDTVSATSSTSCWTGKDAVIGIPVQYHSSTTSTGSTNQPIVLDEYGDLRSVSQHLSDMEAQLPLQQESSSSPKTPGIAPTIVVGLRIVLERYNMSSLKEHVQRCKYLLSSGQLPTITTLYEPVVLPVVLPSTEEASTDVKDTDTDYPPENAKTDKPTVPVSTTTTSAGNGNKTTETKAPPKLLNDLQHIPKNIVVDGTNLQDFFYFIFGEDREMIHTLGGSSKSDHHYSTTRTTATQPNNISNNKAPTKNHHKKNKKHRNGPTDKHSNTATDHPLSGTAASGLPENNNSPITAGTTVEMHATTTTMMSIKEYIQRWNELDELSRCTCQIKIQYSGYHPPPNYRKLFGDFAYLMITIPTTSNDTSINYTSSSSSSSSSSRSSSTKVHITCTTYGFYVNSSVDTTISSFDPSPAVPESHFSHTLLDCLLSASFDFRQLWTMALTAAKERNELNLHPSIIDSDDNSIYQSIFRTTIRGDFDGFRSSASAKQITSEAYDSMIVSPTWLVPSLNKYTDQQQRGWNQNMCHTYNTQRTEDDVLRSYGMIENIRNGTITRDWNEELQVAREMPISTAQERLDRARLIHKVMMEFGEASLHGVMAIAEGQVLPMNPNESIRSQVFLINNIFISRGVDTGPESFKITRGDRAARKASNRDLQCVGIFHRMEGTSRGNNIYTLATVLIDYLGTRFVCQSILPGILIGEKSHTLLYGSVEAGAELKYDENLEEALEAQLGHSFMVAPRPIYRSPLVQSDPQVNVNEIINTCVAVEAKGILGSDQRRYMLDISRLTPRDANWIPEEIGGTGKYEEIKHNDGKIPPSLDDDEWVTCIMRPELITQFTQASMKEKNENETDTKFNVNVFIPSIRQIVDPSVVKQIKDDEALVRDVACYLWDDVLPRITLAIREGAVNQLPVDGCSLTEFLHRNGVNCRYMGRLAMLAQEQEESDGQERKTMPQCWLDLLEVEMVARAAKHVLDEYLSANGGVAALQPALTIASFLCALVSDAEETAAQTETRRSKQSVDEGDEDDYVGLTITDVGGSGDAVPVRIKSRSEIWSDVESEIGRRFRYHVTLFNRGKRKRVLYVPLLRRVCQRIGVKLRSKRYVVGGNCLCGGGSMSGRLIATFPISPFDIVEVMPLMKHAASYKEGFQACSVGPVTVSLPPLQISLPDARSTLERAHIQAGSRAYGLGLQLAQEAATLYQRVTDNAAHPGVIESIDLMSTIFLEAGDPVNAALNCEKALALTLQSGGLDSTAAFNAHQLLFQMLFVAHDMERAVKHLRASIYILELMSGPRHTEQYTAYHKLGTVYSHSDYNGKYLSTALECFREAMNRDSSDRLMDGFMAKNYARTLMGLENFADALECEKKANQTLTLFLGKNHKMTQESDTTMQVLSRLALERGNKGVIVASKNNRSNSDLPKLEAEAAAKIADSIAADLAAEEERITAKKKVGGDKKKRGKK